MKQERLGKEIIRLALPTTVENIFQTLVGFVDTLLIAQLGLVVATALIVQSIGAGDKEAVVYQVHQTVVLSLGIGLVFGVLSLVLGRQMLVLMRADAETLAGVQTFFYWTGVFFDHGWRTAGRGDTKSPLYSTAVGMWGLRVLGVVILGQMLDLGIARVWLSILIDLLLRAIFLPWRFTVKTRKLAD